MIWMCDSPVLAYWILAYSNGRYEEIHGEGDDNVSGVAMSYVEGTWIMIAHQWRL
jgi:hypothetical protein